MDPSCSSSSCKIELFGARKETFCAEAWYVALQDSNPIMTRESVIALQECYCTSTGGGSSSFPSFMTVPDHLSLFNETKHLVTNVMS
jgi:hypothetical protein